MTTKTALNLPLFYRPSQICDSSKQPIATIWTEDPTDLLSMDLEKMDSTGKEIVRLVNLAARLEAACKFAEATFRLPPGTRPSDECEALELLRAALTEGGKS